MNQLYHVEQAFVEEIPKKPDCEEFEYVGLGEVGEVVPADVDGLFDPELVLVERETGDDIGGVLQVALRGVEGRIQQLLHRRSIMLFIPSMFHKSQSINLYRTSSLGLHLVMRRLQLCWNLTI